MGESYLITVCCEIAQTRSISFVIDGLYLSKYGMSVVCDYGVFLICCLMMYEKLLYNLKHEKSTFAVMQRNS